MRVLVLLAIATAGCSTNDAYDGVPGDGGDVPDDSSPDIDAPAEDAEASDLDAWYASMPRCPDDVIEPEEGMFRRPQYPASYLEVVTGADDVPREEPFAATWTGIRRLDPPITRDCLPAFVTDPPGPPCRVDTVIGLTLTDGTPVEIVVGLAFEDLEPFASARPVTVRLGWRSDDQAALPSPTGSLEIRDGDAGSLLLAVRYVRYRVPNPSPLAGVNWTWDDLELAYGDFLCVTEPDPCRRVFASRLLVLTSAGGASTLEPSEPATVGSGGFAYRVTLRRALERMYGVFEGECADATDTAESVELVRLP